MFPYDLAFLKLLQNNKQSTDRGYKWSKFYRPDTITVRLIAKWIEPLRKPRPVPEPVEGSGTTFHLLNNGKGNERMGQFFKKVIRLELFTNPFRYKIFV